ncbi:SLC13 family permease, partial [Campylobacter jejuni]|nr:SLC13 family permease [Campylobacter jejuni]
IFRGLMENSGIEANEAFVNSSIIFAFTIILPIVVLSFFVFNAFKNNIISVISKPDPFDYKQKTTLILMFMMIVVVLIFPVLNIIF